MYERITVLILSVFNTNYLPHADHIKDEKITFSLSCDIKHTKNKKKLYAITTNTLEQRTK